MTDTVEPTLADEPTPEPKREPAPDAGLADGAVREPEGPTLSPEAEAPTLEPASEPNVAAPEAPTPEPEAAVAAPEAPALEPEAPILAPERVAPAEPVAEQPPVVVEPAVPVEPRTVGRLIADALHAAGVTIAFTVPGESFLGLLDALPEAGIRVVATRHEGGAAFMAEAHGQLTGRPAVALATRAVGAANLAIGVHTARADSTPMFAIVGGVHRSLRGREAFQEADIVGSIGRLAKWAVEIDTPARAEALIGEAVRHAIASRPGPVVVSIPEDVLDELVPGASAEAQPFRPTRVEPEPEDVRTVLQLLACARRPVILAGAGVLRSRGTADLIRLAEILEVPVIASWRRGDVFPNDHRLYLGMTGLGSAPTVQDRLATADALVVLGCRLSEVGSFGYAVPALGVPWAHVDLEPRTSHAGLAAPDHAVNADARTFLRVARRRVSSGVLDATSFDARRTANEADRSAFEAASVVDELSWAGPGVHPGRLIATLNELLPPQTIVTTDAGNFAGWATRGYRFRRPGTFLGPTSGAMGYGLPAAIAASIEHPGRPVVALVGDGGFAMTMSELETAVREGARPIAIVFDNARYGTIRVEQERRGTGVGEATELGSVDFAAVARGLGARGVRVDDDAGFEPALREALAAEAPTVIQVTLDRRWKSVGRLDPA
jgi:acetolactate synthase I/II/III large subunit